MPTTEHMFLFPRKGAAPSIYAPPSRTCHEICALTQSMHLPHKSQSDFEEKIISYYKTKLEIAANGLHNVNMRDSRFITTQVAWQCHIQALNCCWLLGFWGSCGCIVASRWLHCAASMTMINSGSKNSKKHQSTWRQQGWQGRQRQDT